MFAPSASRSPVAPVEPARSEPAKSIRLILETRLLRGVPSSPKNFYVKVMHETVCALEELAFMFVCPIALFEVPVSI